MDLTADFPIILQNLFTSITWNTESRIPGSRKTKNTMFCRMIIVWIPGMDSGEIWVPQGPTTCSGSVTNIPQQIPHVGILKPCLWVGQAAEGGRDVLHHFFFAGAAFFALDAFGAAAFFAILRGGEGETERRMKAGAGPRPSFFAPRRHYCTPPRGHREPGLGPTVPRRCKRCSGTSIRPRLPVPIAALLRFWRTAARCGAGGPMRVLVRTRGAGSGAEACDNPWAGLKNCPNPGS